MSAIQQTIACHMGVSINMDSRLYFAADDNIKQLAFEENRLLVGEFDRIFNDFFDHKGATYKKILESLKDGAKTLSEVRIIIDFPHSGTLSAMMEHLPKQNHLLFLIYGSSDLKIDERSASSLSYYTETRDLKKATEPS